VRFATIVDKHHSNTTCISPDHPSNFPLGIESYLRRTDGRLKGMEIDNVRDR